MGLQQPQDRMSQAEFNEIIDALDISGSIGLNARQPSSAHAATSRESVAAPAAAAPATAGAQDAAQQSASSDVVKAQREQDTASASASANPEEQSASTAAAAAETPTTEKQQAEGTQEGKKDGEGQPSKDNSTPSTAGAVAAAAAASAAAPAAPGAEVATLQQILRVKDCNLALVSDVDEQLLLNISFKQPVRLASFSMLATNIPRGFSTNADEEDSVSAPMMVKVYCNKSTLNFCGVVDEVCAFSVLLSEEDVLSGRRIALPGSKFHMCSSAQFFIQENQKGSAYTFLNRLVFYGAAHKRYS